MALISQNWAIVFALLLCYLAVVDLLLLRKIYRQRTNRVWTARYLGWYISHEPSVCSASSFGILGEDQHRFFREDLQKLCLRYHVMLGGAPSSDEAIITGSKAACLRVIEGIKGIGGTARKRMPGAPPKTTQPPKVAA